MAYTSESEIRQADKDGYSLFRPSAHFSLARGSETESPRASMASIAAKVVARSPLCRPGQRQCCLNYGTGKSNESRELLAAFLPDTHAFEAVSAFFISSAVAGRNRGRL